MSNTNWKFPDGSTKSFNDLTNKEIKAFQKLMVKKLQICYNKFQTLNSLFESLESELIKRNENNNV